MLTIHNAAALVLGALLAASLAACSKQDSQSPNDPPMGVATKTTPDTGGTGTAPAPDAALPSPPGAATGAPVGADTAGAGSSGTGASGGSAATQGTQPIAPSSGTTPATATPPADKQPGR